MPQTGNNYGVNGQPSAQDPYSEPLLPSTKLPLLDLCAHINARVTQFLAVEPRTEQIRSVQEQTRTALKVIDEALGRYRSVTSQIIEIVQ